MWGHKENFPHLKCQNKGGEVILGILSDLVPWEESCQCFLDDLPGRGDPSSRGDPSARFHTHNARQSLLPVSPLKQDFRSFPGKVS